MCGVIDRLGPGLAGGMGFWLVLLLGGIPEPGCCDGGGGCWCCGP